MDLSSSQSPATDTQRHVFFGAEDLRIRNRPAGPEEKYLTMEKTRRSQMAENVIANANNLANAVRTLRSFDRTGNAELALAHLQATFADLQNHTQHLVAEVQAAADRHSVALTPPPAKADPVAQILIDIDAGVLPRAEAIRRITPATVARGLR